MRQMMGRWEAVGQPCLVGQSGSNLNDETVWRVAFSGEPERAGFSLVPVTDAGWFEEPHGVVTPPAVRARLRARFAAEGFVDLAPLRRALSAVAYEWAPGVTVRWLHRRTFRGGENAAPRGTDRIEVRWQPGGPPVTLTAWEDRPVAEPMRNCTLARPGAFQLKVVTPKPLPSHT